MRRSALLAATTVAGAALIGTAASGDRPAAAVSTARSARTRTSRPCIGSLGLEGLTADGRGNLYAPARTSRRAVPDHARAGGRRCRRVHRRPHPGAVRRRPGSAFDRDGELFVTDGADERDPPPAPERARTRRPRRCSPTGVPGANGVAFDERGDLWVSDGTTGQGRVWRIGDDGKPARGLPRAADGQRRQPAPTDGARRRGRSRPALGAAGDGDDHAGRAQRRQHGSAPSTSWPTASRSTATGRCSSATPPAARSGASSSSRRGELRSPTGCDTTFTVEHAVPQTTCSCSTRALEGVDGIALDREGNVIAAANERNAVVVATARDGVVELFRNPVARGRGCATRGRSSSRPARCSSTAGCA